MAFVSRAERKYQQKNSVNTLGPGAYMGHNQYKQKVSYAPFQSTAERDPAYIKGSNHPGPGSYSQTGFNAGGHTFNKDMYIKSAIAPFATSSERFKSQKMIQQPGPGSYNLGTAWGSKKQITPKKEWNAVDWLRIPSAPSIPAANQAFGYEETPTGELIMQKNPDKVHTGHGADTVGPGQYNLNGGQINKGPSWSKSRSKREVEFRSTTAPTLGPGSYFEGKVNLTPIYKHRQNAVFQSNVKRQSYIPPTGSTHYQEEDSEESSGDEGVPGPGHYHNDYYSSIKPRQVQQEFQCFGSKTDRFKTVQQKKEQDVNKLGPGCYGDLRKPIAERKVGDSRAPFSSTNIRFEQKIDQNPGPGSYKNSQLTDNVQKKVWGRHGVFGSTERRFVGQKVENKPGPGHYPPDAHKRIGIHNSAQRKATSVFVSKSKRDLQTQNKDYPAPGQYELKSTIGAQKYIESLRNPVLLHITDKDKKKVGFSTQQKRFKSSFIPKPTSELGPGYYEVGESKPPKPQSIYKGALGKDDRFKYKSETTPGPGTYYDEDIQQNWNKKSYNILFSELE